MILDLESYDHVFKDTLALCKRVGKVGFLIDSFKISNGGLYMKW